MPSAASWAATASPRGAPRARRREKNSPLDHRDRRGVHREERQEEPVRPRRREERARCKPAERRAKAAALAPTIRGLASHDRPMVGHFTDDPRVLDFLASAEAPAPRRARHQLPRPLPAHQGQADAARPAGGRLRRGLDRPSARCCTRSTAPTTRSTTRSTPTPDSPAMRGADPLIVLVPGVGMFSYGANKQTARVAGEFYLNAINVMRGAEAISTYTPISDAREVPHRVLGARGGEAAADAEAEVPRDARRARDRRGIRHRQGDRDPARRRRRVRRHRRPRPRRRRRMPRPSSAAPTSRSASPRTSPTPPRSTAWCRMPCSRSAASTSS